MGVRKWRRSGGRISIWGAVGDAGRGEAWRGVGEDDRRQAGTPEGSGGLKASARAQTSAQPVAGRAQPACNAGHSSLARSSAQPGSCDQLTGTQRARGRCSAVGLAAAGQALAGLAAVAAGAAAAPAAEAPACGAGSEGGGGLAHAPSSRNSTSRLAARRRGPVRSDVLALRESGTRPGRDNRCMWLILLEALGAGLVLIVIVWWTMFSGRRGGERADDDDPLR